MMNKMAELVHDEAQAQAALFEDGLLVDYISQASEDEGAYHIGAIIYARIMQVFPKQNRAQCQLPNGELASFRTDKSQKWVVGQLCWITLVAMGRQHKPWQAEAGISRAGRLIVLHYEQDGLRVSHKAKAGLAEDVIAGVKAGLKDGLKDDLTGRWGGVLKRACLSLAQSGISGDEVVALILAESQFLAEAVSDEAVAAMAQSNEAGVLYQGDNAPQLLALSVSGDEVARREERDEIWWEEVRYSAQQACERVVELPSGICLSFEQTQAVLAVDVDSGTSRLGPVALAKQACGEIMRIIRLASYSGVIIVDMPRMSPQDMAHILEMMRKSAAKDIRHPDVLGLSRAGLIEMVVRHRLSPLVERLGRL